MLISKKWLEEYVKVPKGISAKELAEKMTVSMAEVEGVIDQARALDGVIVAEILEVIPHPNADRLQVATVTDGKKKFSIVCGAPNIKAGQRVPLATVGTTLPNGMVIEQRPVRGVESQGMLCAEDEIGLGSSHEGIVVLGDNAKLGKPLSEVLGLTDVIFEFDNKSLTHRPDLWSHYGIARELSVIFDEPLAPYAPSEISTGKGRLSIEVKDHALCPRYMGIMIKGITVGESPEWLKKKLRAVGLRPINTIVDITNFVLNDIGQPLHAFDYEKLEGTKIIIRSAKKGERITALDDQIYELTESNLVIADQKNPVAIAGVIGGRDSAISEHTKTIVIESANFDHVSIRKTSGALGVRTDASMRFEKSLDPNGAALGMKRAVELILELCPGATVVSKLEDVKKFKLNQGPISVSYDFLNKRIGSEIPRKEVIAILEKLGFSLTEKKEGIDIVVPTWRATKDISIPEDIVEEVARIYGFSAISAHMPLLSIERPIQNPRRIMERKIKTLLSLGYDMTEVYTYSFVKEKYVGYIGGEVSAHISIANPLDKTMSLLRRSLIPNLLQATSENERFFDTFNLFEIGRTFIPEEKGVCINDEGKKFLPKQDTFVSGIIHRKDELKPFFVAKNIVEGLLRQLRIPYELKEPKMVDHWADGHRSLLVVAGEETVGIIAEVSSSTRADFGIESLIGAFELNMTALVALYNPAIQFTPIPKFPAIEMDISVVVGSAVKWKDIRDCVVAVQKDLIRDVILFDVYEGEGIAQGQKSVGFRVEYRSDDKTLERKEVEKIHDKVRKELEKKYNATLRI